MDLAALQRWADAEFEPEQPVPLLSQTLTIDPYRLAGYFQFRAWPASERPVVLEGLLGLRGRLRTMCHDSRLQVAHGVSTSLLLACPWWRFETRSRALLEAVVEEVDAELRDRKNGQGLFDHTAGYLLAVKAVASHRLLGGEEEQRVLRSGSEVHTLLVRALHVASAPTAPLMVNVHMFVVMLRFLNQYPCSGTNDFGESFRTDVKDRLENTFARMRAGCQDVTAALEFVTSFEKMAVARIEQGNEE